MRRAGSGYFDQLGATLIYQGERWVVLGSGEKLAQVESLGQHARNSDGLIR